MPDPDLFGRSKAAKSEKTIPPLPDGTVHRLIGVYVELFKKEFNGERPAVQPLDGKSLKSLATEFGEGAVNDRLSIFVGLDDPYLRNEGYPLRLLRGAWNKCTARLPQAKPTTAKESKRTTDYLRNLQGGSRG